MAEEYDAAEALLKAMGPAVRKKMEFDKRTGRTSLDPEYERQLKMKRRAAFFNPLDVKDLDSYRLMTEEQRQNWAKRYPYLAAQLPTRLKDRLEQKKRILSALSSGFNFGMSSSGEKGPWSYLIDERVEPLIGNLPETRKWELFQKSFGFPIAVPELVQPAKDQLRSEAIIEKFNRQTTSGGGSGMGRRSGPADPDLMMAYEEAKKTGHEPLESVQKLSDYELKGLLEYLEPETEEQQKPKSRREQLIEDFLRYGVEE